jgi:hypothetical protein
VHRLLLGILTVLLAGPAAAADTPCADVLRLALLTGLRARVPKASPRALHHVVCRLARSKGTPPEGLAITPRQLEAAGRLLCAGALQKADLRPAGARLKRLLTTPGRQAVKDCTRLARRGVTVHATMAGGAQTIVDLVVVSTRRRRPGYVAPVPSAVRAAVGIETIKIEHEGWADAGALESTPPVSQRTSHRVSTRSAAPSPFVGAFTRAAGSGTLGVRTDAGDLSLEFLTDVSERAKDRALIEESLGSPPAIADCVAFHDDPTILRCTSRWGYEECLDELQASTLHDCRADVPPSDDSLIADQPPDPAAIVSVTSTLGAVVRRSARGAGSTSGGGGYEVRIPTVARPPATSCDPSCPIGGPDPCNRDCFRADAWREPVTGEAGSLWSIGVLGGVPCNPLTPVTGDVSPDDIDLYRAWEACDAANAWGGSTEIALTLKVGKVFQFNDPHTTHSRGLLHNEWTWTNTAEVVKSVKLVDVPVAVECRDSMTAAVD